MYNIHVFNLVFIPFSRGLFTVVLSPFAETGPGAFLQGGVTGRGSVWLVKLGVQSFSYRILLFTSLVFSSTIQTTYPISQFPVRIGIFIYVYSHSQVYSGRRREKLEHHAVF